MITWAKRLALLAAVALLVLTVLNASWLAPQPSGAPILVAHRGIHQNFDYAGIDPQTGCLAQQIEQPVHDYIENTTRSMAKAQQMGAQVVEVDIAPTKDGRIAVFHDRALDCRTEARGKTSDLSMADLKALDIGYGYTADGGKTFPLRGTGTGAMPTLEEALITLPRTPIIFNLQSSDTAEAELLAAALEATGRDVAKIGDVFYGKPQAVARMAELYPDNWAWDRASAERCGRDYVLLGWSTYLPASCRGQTMIVPLDRQWAFWGWPNRLIARMEEHGGRVLVVGPGGDAMPDGLVLPEQLTQIPNSYNGYVWVEDIWTLGPALRPSLERRTPPQQMAAQEGLERRRARLGL